MQYTIEPGLARGFWVLDSHAKSKLNNRRYMRWFQTSDDANAHAKLLNTTTEVSAK